jgi:rubrerythrin
MGSYFLKYSFNNSFLKTMALIIIGLNSSSFQAQTNTQDFTVPPKVGFRCRAEIVNGDTLPLVLLNTIYVYTEYVFRTPRQYEQWTRVKHNVKKVYPYAILAAAKLKEYDKALEKMQDEDLKKAFLKVCEKDLRSEFEDELKNLTISQGKVLMKLIDRESGKTTYEVVKQLRGSFQAAMWQTLARLFGNNMKTEYDAQVEDIMIERAIKLVENGQF